MGIHLNLPSQNFKNKKTKSKLKLQKDNIKVENSMNVTSMTSEVKLKIINHKLIDTTVIEINIQMRLMDIKAT